MQIGELATQLGISRDTLRFYERRGLIHSHRRPNGYRHYGPEALLTLRFVITAKKLGFTLAEIGEELPSGSGSQIDSDRLVEILRNKLRVIDQRICEMKSMRKELEKLLDSVCPVILSSTNIEPKTP